MDNKPRILALYNELTQELTNLGWKDCGGTWRHPEGGYYNFENALTLARAKVLREEEPKKEKR